MRKIYSGAIILTLFFLTPLFSNTSDDIVENEAGSTEVEKEEPEQGQPLPVSDVSEEDEAGFEGELGYNLKLRNLEESINSLKDKIFRSKQRLAILQETVMSGSIAGARATIIHKNNVGGAFRLISAIYYLDEAPVFKRINQPEELEAKKITVFESSVVPGPHHISAYFVYQGRGFGIFSYMKGYSFKIKSGHSFIVEEGSLVEITVSPEDRGSAVQVEDRLNISFDVARKTYHADVVSSGELTEN